MATLPKISTARELSDPSDFLQQEKSQLLCRQNKGANSLLSQELNLDSSCDEEPTEEEEPPTLRIMPISSELEELPTDKMLKSPCQGPALDPEDLATIPHCPEAASHQSAIKLAVEPNLERVKAQQKSISNSNQKTLFGKLIGDGPPISQKKKVTPFSDRSTPRAHLRILPSHKEKAPKKNGPRKAKPSIKTIKSSMKSPPNKNSSLLVIRSLRDSKPDLHEVGNATPADSPSARRKQKQHHKFNHSEKDQAIRGEWLDQDTPPLHPTMPAQKAPRVLISKELKDEGALRLMKMDAALWNIKLKAITNNRHDTIVEESTYKDEIERTTERWFIIRWWPLLLTLALVAIAAGTVIGLLVRHQGKVSQRLSEARSLTNQHQLPALRKALQKVREAADLDGRQPEMMSLAAAIHAELAFDFGESDLKSIQSLIEESTRLEAKNIPRAAADLAVANAYLMLAINPLPEAISYLFKSSERHPKNQRLKLIYGAALLRNQELSLAKKILDSIPQKSSQVLKTRALLCWRLGLKKLARKTLQSAQSSLEPQFVELTLRRFQIEEGFSDKAAEKSLRTLVESKKLSKNQKAWAQLLLAIILKDLKKPKKAMKILDKALPQHPLADGEFHFQASKLLIHLHRFKEAYREAKLACQISPRDIRFITHQAAVEVAMYKPQAAIQRLTQIEELDANSQLLLAKAHLQTGELAKARSLIQKLPRELWVEKMLMRARLALAVGQPDQALKELNQLKPGQQTLEQLLIRGLAALELGTLANAVKRMKAVLERDPLNAEALWTLGVVARRRGNAKEASLLLSRAAEVYPNYFRSRLELGKLQLELGNLKLARTHFDHLLALDANSFTALKGRTRIAVELVSAKAPLFFRRLEARGYAATASRFKARYLMMKGQWKEASFALKTVLRKHITNRQEVILWLAQALKQSGKIKEATTLYQKILKQDNNNPEALLGLSEINLEYQRLGSALRQCLAASSSTTRGIFSLGLKVRIGIQLARCYRMAEALGASIAELQDVLDLDRASFSANLELGLIYASLNKKSRAALHLAQAHKANRNDKGTLSKLKIICQGLAHPPAECP